MANSGLRLVHVTTHFGYLVLLITRTFLSGPVRFEITSVDCSLYPEKRISLIRVCNDSCSVKVSKPLGEATLSFSFFHPCLNRVNFYKERICSLMSKFFPLRGHPILEKLCITRLKALCHKSCSSLRNKFFPLEEETPFWKSSVLQGSKQEVTKVMPLQKWQKRMEVYP